MDLRKCYRVVVDFESSKFEECPLEEIRKGDLFILEDDPEWESEGYFEDGTVVNLATEDGFVAESGIPTINCETLSGRTSLPAKKLLENQIR